MTMRKFLPLLATAAAAAALATGCVTNGAITTLDLTDTNGETLQSVSEWDPGESHTYSMPTLPDGCEVNIVSSDPSLLSAELSEGTLTLTAENTGKPSSPSRWHWTATPSPRAMRCRSPTGSCRSGSL